MKKFRLCLVLLMSLSIAAAYAGGNWSDVTVTNITIYTSEGSPPRGYMVVTLSANGPSTPSCASGYPKNLVIDVTNDAGRMAAAMASEALTLDAPVTVAGTGLCSISSSAETMASIQFQGMRTRQ
jgi:hypothetical protein